MAGWKRREGFGIIIDIIVGIVGGWLSAGLDRYFFQWKPDRRLAIALVGVIILIWIIWLIRRA